MELRIMVQTIDCLFQLLFCSQLQGQVFGLFQESGSIHEQGLMDKALGKTKQNQINGVLPWCQRQIVQLYLQTIQSYTGYLFEYASHTALNRKSFDLPTCSPYLIFELQIVLMFSIFLRTCNASSTPFAKSKQGLIFIAAETHQLTKSEDLIAKLQITLIAYHSHFMIVIYWKPSKIQLYHVINQDQSHGQTPSSIQINFIFCQQLIYWATKYGKSNIGNGDCKRVQRAQICEIRKEYSDLSIFRVQRQITISFYYRFLIQNTDFYKLSNFHIIFKLQKSLIAKTRLW